MSNVTESPFVPSALHFGHCGPSNDLGQHNRLEFIARLDKCW